MSVLPGGFFFASVSNKQQGIADTDLGPMFYGDGLNETPEEPFKERLLSWRVVDSEKEMDSFEFTLDNNDMALWDSPLLQKGNSVNIRYGSEGNFAGPFEGVITGRSGWRTVVITGEFKGELALSNIQKAEKFLQKKLSDIASELFIREGLVPEVEDSVLVLPVVIRRDETVLQFLKRKAKETGGAWEAYVEGNRGFFIRKQLEKKPSLILRYATEEQDSDYRTIGEPNFRDEQKNTATEEKVRGFNMKDKKAIDESANNESSTQTALGKGTFYFDAASGTRKYRPPTARATAETGRSVPTQKQTKAEASGVAGSKFDKKNAKAFSLDWTVLGDASIKAKTTAQVICPSQFISDTRWYIEQVEHGGDAGSFNTTIKMISNASGETAQTEEATPSGGTNTKKADPEANNKIVYKFDPVRGTRVPVRG